MKMKVTAARTSIYGSILQKGDIVTVKDKEFAKKLERYGIAEFLQEVEKPEAFLDESIPKGADLNSMTIEDLIALAKSKGLQVKSNMKKETIIKMIEGEGANNS